MKTMSAKEARGAIRDSVNAPIVTPQIARRTLLAVMALAPTVYGCAGLTTIPAEVGQDALLIANGLASILPQLGTFLGGGALATATTGINTIISIAKALQSALTTTSAEPLLLQMEAALNSVVGVFAGMNLPNPIGSVLTAASVLLPFIESLIGMNFPPSPPAPAGRWMWAVRARVTESNGMSVPSARLILRAAVARARR